MPSTHVLTNPDLSLNREAMRLRCEARVQKALSRGEKWTRRLQDTEARYVEDEAKSEQQTKLFQLGLAPEVIADLGGLFPNVLTPCQPDNRDPLSGPDTEPTSVEVIRNAKGEVSGVVRWWCRPEHLKPAEAILTASRGSHRRDASGRPII